MRSKTKKKIECIDLFSGIGGLTYGLEKAGIRVLAGLDNDASCAFAYEKNSKAKFINADIAKYDFNNLQKMYSKNSIKVLVGCAPCQPFSSHTFKAHNSKKKDEKWGLLDYFIQAIKVVQPDIVSMENVRGVIKADVFENFVNQLEAMSYEVEYKVVYAPDYGVPQNRSRLILLASRIGKIQIPVKTHERRNYITVGEVIRNLQKIEAGETHRKDAIHKTKKLAPINIARIRQSKPSSTWKDWDKKLLPKCYKKTSGQTYTSVYGRMDWNNVSPTITTQFTNYGSGRFGHPEQDRALSVREGALLQTFPKQYEFGNFPMTVLCRQIGNAVPPKLGYVIGKVIKKHVDEYA